MSFFRKGKRSPEESPGAPLEDRVARIGTGSYVLSYYGAVLWAIECHTSGDVGEVTQAVASVESDFSRGVTEWTKAPSGPTPRGVPHTRYDD